MFQPFQLTVFHFCGELSLYNHVECNINLESLVTLYSNVFTVGWGSWYDHVKGYWKECKEKNILYMLYEDMKEV